jgi:heptosyltransferase-2
VTPAALDPERVLCVAPHWVGDSLFFLPAVDALRRRFPRAGFGLLAKAGIAALHKDSGRFDRIHALAPGAGRLERFRAHLGLRGQGYGLAVVFPDSFSSALAAALSGAPVRVGRRGEGRSFLLSGGFRLPARDRQRHVVDEYLDLAARVPRLQPPALGVEERQRLFREQGLGVGLLVGLCPTSAYGPAKEWPAEHWVSLAKQLIQRRFSVALFCAPNELERLAPLAREAGAPLLAPGLPGLAACLAACELVVANDSGPLHLAAAVGARALGLYGPVSPRWSAPLSPRAEALSLDLDCSPCHAKVCPLGHHRCLRDLTPERVLAAFDQVMKR